MRTKSQLIQGLIFSEKKWNVLKKKEYTADYLDPNKRSIANAIQIFYKDGNKSELIEVEYPIGHQRRRDKGIPKLIEKFKAKALQKGRLNVLTGVAILPKESEYGDALKKTSSDWTADVEKIIVQYDHGMAAYSDLILSMNTEKVAGRVAFEIVKQAKTTENPDGDPKWSLDNLIKKYKAKTAPNFIKMYKQFTNSKLSNDEDDPDEWNNLLETLRTQMNKIKITRNGLVKLFIKMIWIFP